MPGSGICVVTPSGWGGARPSAPGNNSHLRRILRDTGVFSWMGRTRIMFRIAEARFLAPGIKLFEIVAPRVARRRQAGQFVIVRLHERGERIPLTIADSNPDGGTITLIVQGVGKTTKLMNRLEGGQFLLDVVGPLGRPSEVGMYGTVVVIGGGVGAAIAYPTSVALKAAGNHVISIIGARTKELVILEEGIRATSDETYITTDDGSCGEKGLVTETLSTLLNSGRHIDYVLAVGPVPMMKAVAEATRPKGIKTTVSLNAIMVDGTGMCGGCRVLVGNQSKFTCVDGPEFDAHQVNFDVLSQRNAMYQRAEREALDEFLEHPDDDMERIQRQCKLEEKYPELTRLREA